MLCNEKCLLCLGVHNYNNRLFYLSSQMVEKISNILSVYLRRLTRGIMTADIIGVPLDDFLMTPLGKTADGFDIVGETCQPNRGGGGPAFTTHGYDSNATKVIVIHEAISKWRNPDEASSDPVVFYALMTRYVRWVTPGDTLTLVHSSSTGSIPKYSNSLTPRPSKTGTRSI